MVLSSVLNSIGAKLLTIFFKKYIENVESNQLITQLFKGTVQLNNINLLPTALSNHDLPFTITSGTIATILMIIPLKSITSKPCQILIDGINIVAKFSKDIVPNNIDMRDIILKELDDQNEQSDEESQGQSQGIINTIVKNIEIKISNVNISLIVDALPDQSYKLGLSLQELHCFTVDENNQPAFVSKNTSDFRKQLNITGLSIFIDPKNTNNNHIPSPHYFIMNNFSMSGKYVKVIKDGKLQTQIQSNINKLCFRISQEQLNVLAEFAYQHNMFKLRSHYFSCGKPQSEVRSQRSSTLWWCYAHRCSVEKKSPHRLNIDEMLTILKIRNKYYHLWQKKKSMPLEQFQSTNEYTELQKFDNELDLNVIFAFRVYSDYKLRRLEREQEMSIQDVEKSDQESDEIIPVDVFSESSLVVSLTIETVQLQMIHNSKTLLTLRAEQLKGVFSKAFNLKNVFSFQCNRFQIFSTDSIIFEQGNSGQFSLMYSSFKLEQEAVVNGISPIINVDLKLLHELKTIFIDNGLKSSPSVNKSFQIQTDSTNSEMILNSLETNRMIRAGPQAQVLLQQKCDAHPYFKMALTLTNPQINVNGLKMKFQMDKIELNSNPMHQRSVQNIESLYDNYTILLSNFSVSVNNDIILKPVTTSIELWSIIAPCELYERFKLELKLTSLSLELSQKTYSEIISGMNFLMNLSNELETNQNTRQTIIAKKAQRESNELSTIALQLKSSVKFSFEKVSLNFVEIGEFSLLDFTSQLTLTSQIIKAEFDLLNILCRSSEKQFVQFVLDQEQKAISGKFEYQFNTSRKTEISMNSPILAVDFEWIQKMVTFIQSLNEQIETNTQTEQTTSLAQPPSDNQEKPSESSIAQETTIILKEPVFKFVLPPIVKDELIEYSLSFNQIQFSQMNLLVLSHFVLKYNDRPLSEPTDLRFNLADNIFSIDSVRLNIIEYDYPLILEFSNYLTYTIDYYFPSQPNTETDNKIEDSSSPFQIKINSIFIHLENYFDVKCDQFGLNISDTISIDLKNIEGRDSDSIFVQSNSFSLLKNEDQITMIIADSTTINDHLEIIHLIYDYFVDRQFPKKIKVPESDSTSSLTITLETKDLNINLEQLTLAKFDTFILLFNLKPNANSISIKSNKIEFIERSNEKQDFLSCGNFGFSSSNSLIEVNMNELFMNFDLTELMNHIHYFTIIVSGFPDGQVNPMTMPELLYKVQINKVNILMNFSSILLSLDSFMMENSLEKIMTLDFSAKIVTVLSQKQNSRFLVDQEFKFSLIFDVKDTPPPLKSAPLVENALQHHENLTENPLKTDDAQKVNYLHSLHFIFIFSNVTFTHNYDLCDLCDALNYLMNNSTPAIDFKSNRTPQIIEKQEIEYEFNMTYSFEIGLLLFIMPNYPNISINHLKFIMDNRMTLQIGSFALNNKEILFKSTSEKTLKFILASNLLLLEMNGLSATIDLESKLLVDFLSEIINSPLLTKLNFSNDKEEKIEQQQQQPKKQFALKLNEFSLDLIHQNKKFSLFINLSIEYSHESISIFIQPVSLSFSIGGIQYKPFLSIDIVQLNKNNKELTISLANCNVSISTYDIFDIQHFIQLLTTKYGEFQQKTLTTSPKSVETDENEGEQSNSSLENIVFNYFTFSFSLFEDNRNAINPFLRACVDQLPAKSIVIKTGYSGFKVSADIFNNLNQKWDSLIEPFEIEIIAKSSTDFSISFPKGLNFIVSKQALKEITNFEFKKNENFQQKPCYVIVNNSDKEYTFIFDGTEKLIKPGLTPIFTNQPFIFLKRSINIQNLYSPQFIQKSISLSIRTKNNTKYLFIDLPFIIKNRSSVDLIYRYSNQAKLLKANSNTSLLTISEKFMFSAKNSTKNVQMTLSELKKKKVAFFSSLVNRINLKFRLEYHIEQNRGVVYFIIRPQYSVFNSFPEPVRFIVPELNLNLKLNPSSATDLITVGDKNEFDFKVQIGNQISNLSTLYLGETYGFPVYFNPHNAVSVTNDTSVITIRPCCIIHNSTELDIKIFDFKDYPIADVHRNEKSYIGPLDYFSNQNKVSISFEVEDYQKTNKFELVIGQEILFLISKSHQGFYLPVVLTTSVSGSGIFHLKINYYVSIQNLTNHALCFYPCNKESSKNLPSILVHKNEIQPILLTNQELKFMLFIKDIPNCFEQIDLQNDINSRQIHSTLFFTNQAKTDPVTREIINNRIEFDVRFSFINGHKHYIVVFKEISIPQPIMISNCLDEIIHLPDTDLIVPPQTTTVVSYKSLYIDTILFTVNNRTVSVDLNIVDTPFIPKTGMNIKYEVRTLPNGCRLIVVSNAAIKQIFSNKSNLNVSINLPLLSLSIIDDTSHELLCLSLNNAMVTYCQDIEHEIQSIAINIQAFQIDDMCPSTVCRVAAFSSKTQFLSLNISKSINASSSINLIDLKLGPLTLYLDGNFVSEIIHFVTTINNKPKEANEPKSEDQPTTSSFFIKELKIDRIQLLLYFSSRTGRPKYHQVDSLSILSLIPTISAVPLKRKLFEMKNVSTKQFDVILREFYNPLLKKIYLNIAPRAIGMLFKTLSTALQTDNAGRDTPFNRQGGEVVHDGIKSFASNIESGVVNIIMDPIKGFKEEGIRGFFKGIQNGSLKRYLGFGAGIIDMASGAAGEITNLFSANKDPQRLPRAFLNDGQIVPYNSNVSFCQFLYQHTVNDFSDCFVHYIFMKNQIVAISQQSLVVFSPNQKCNSAISITSRSLKLTDGPYMIIFLQPISDIKAISYENTKIMITFGDNGKGKSCNKFDVECQSKSEATIFGTIIHSQFYLNDLFRT